MSKSFGRLQALREVSFSLDYGTCLGLVGPNGAGKTTCLRILAGLVPSFDGDALVAGDDPRMAATKAGTLIERPAFYPYLSVRGNLEFFAAVAGIDSRVIPGILEQVGLVAVDDRKAGVLSHGNRQRLGLAIALLSDPYILLLDEPLTGLDPTGQMEVRRLLLERTQRGAAVMISSHNLSELEAVAQRLLFIKDGRTVGGGEIGTFTTGRIVRLRVTERARAEEILGRYGYDVTATPDGWLVVPVAQVPDTGALVRRLGTDGLYPQEVLIEQRSLEDVYVELLGDD